MSKLTEITNFENDLTNLLKNIKFRAAKGYFQQQLMQDLRNIKNTKTTSKFANKTSNVYKIPKEHCEKLVNKAITRSSRKVSIKKQQEIKNQGENVLKNKKVIKKMCVNGKQNCFITLKDHQPNVENNPTVALLNSSKNIKTMVDKISFN